MNIAIIFAGGVGTRMHSKDTPKQFLKMNGKPILIYTLEHFQNNSLIDAIILVCVQNWIEYAKALINQYGLTKVVDIVSGGKTGQLSIYNGLCSAKKYSNGKKSVVLIHDGVRPFINNDIINKNIEYVKKFGSAITTVAVIETVLVIDDNGNIKSVPSRDRSRLARAPQSFWLDDIIENHNKALELGLDNFIDSCTLMKHFGAKMKLVDGPKENIKITTPEDFYIMRALLQVKEDAQLYIME